MDSAAVAGGADEEGEGLAVGVVGAQADTDRGGVRLAGERFDLVLDSPAAVGLFPLILRLQALEGCFSRGQAGLVLGRGLELALGGGVGLPRVCCFLFIWDGEEVVVSSRLKNIANRRDIRLILLQRICPFPTIPIRVFLRNGYL